MLADTTTEKTGKKNLVSTFKGILIILFGALLWKYKIGAIQ